MEQILIVFSMIVGSGSCPPPPPFNYRSSNDNNLFLPNSLTDNLKKLVKFFFCLEIVIEES